MKYGDLVDKMKNLVDEMEGVKENSKRYNELQEMYYEVDREIAKKEYLTDDRINEFLSYMHDTFPEPMSNHFTYDLIRNLVVYAYEKKGHTSWSALYMIADIIPEVDAGELEEYLTRFGFKKEN